MSLIGSVGQVASNPYVKMSGLMRPETTDLKPGQLIGKPGELGLTKGPESAGFGQVFEKLIDTVQSKQATAAQASKQVLMGESDQMHQSVIAMQEASVAFSLMIEVRNKLVESYQELMRMPV